MGFNKGVLFGFKGILRIVTVVLGVVTLGLAAGKFYRIPREQFFLAMVVIILLATLIWTAMLILLNKMTPSCSKKLDVVLLLIFGMLLLISTGVWFFSVAKKEPELVDRCKSQTVFTCPSFNQPQRLAAGVFGLANGFLYLVLAALVVFSKKPGNKSRWT